MTMIAEYYKGGRDKPNILVFSAVHDGRRRTEEEMYVADKREARTLAKQRGYVPWNF